MMRRFWFIPLTLLILVVVMAGIGIRMSRRVREATPDTGEILVDIPQGYSYAGGATGRHLDITPDGKNIVYVGESRTGPPRLYVQAIGKAPFSELAGTDFAADPSVSRDSRYVAFYANQKIKRAALDGSGVSVIGDSPPIRGIAWLDEETLILGPIRGSLLRMSVQTGTTAPLWEFMGPSLAHLHPNVLPGNKGVLFTLAEGPLSHARIGVLSLKDGKEHLLLEENAYAPAYSPTGHIVFAHGPHRELMAVPLDLDRLEVIGSPQPAGPSAVSGQGTGGSTDYAFSSTGTLIYTTPHEDSIDDVLATMGGLDLTQIHVVPNWFGSIARRAATSTVFLGESLRSYP
jgi:hypothetical protein